MGNHLIRPCIPFVLTNTTRSLRFQVPNNHILHPKPVKKIMTQDPSTQLLGTWTLRGCFGCGLSVGGLGPGFGYEGFVWQSLVLWQSFGPKDLPFEVNIGVICG